MNKLKKLFIFIFIFSIFLKGGISMADEKKDTIHMTLKDGLVDIETKPEGVTEENVVKQTTKDDKVETPEDDKSTSLKMVDASLKKIFLSIYLLE